MTKVLLHCVGVCASARVFVCVCVCECDTERENGGGGGGGERYCCGVCNALSEF